MSSYHDLSSFTHWASIDHTVKTNVHAQSLSNGRCVGLTLIQSFMLLTLLEPARSRASSHIQIYQGTQSVLNHTRA